MTVKSDFQNQLTIVIAESDRLEALAKQTEKSNNYEVFIDYKRRFQMMDCIKINMEKTQAILDDIETRIAALEGA